MVSHREKQCFIEWLSMWNVKMNIFLLLILRLECKGSQQPAFCPQWAAEQVGCRGQIWQKDRRRILQVQVVTVWSVSGLCGGRQSDIDVVIIIIIIIKKGIRKRTIQKRLVWKMAVEKVPEPPTVHVGPTFVSLCFLMHLTTEWHFCVWEDKMK